jgi:hypothetical protein
MDFTSNFWIGLVVGAVVGLIVCKVMKFFGRDTGPHKVTPPPPPPE